MVNIVPPDFPNASPCRIAFVAEAPGAEEDRYGRPLVGPSGALFTHTLRRLGIDRAACYVGNVFSTRPSHNNINHFFLTKKGHAAFLKENPSYITTPPSLRGSKVLNPLYQPDIDRLRADLLRVQPNIVVCMGAVALWAVAGHEGILKYRGNIEETNHLGFPLKVIGTYHPAAILRQRENFVYFYHDLRKAEANSTQRNTITYSRKIHIPQRVADVEQFIGMMSATPHLPIVYDIETEYKNIRQIESIGFANNPLEAYVVPLISYISPDYSYWPTISAETKVLHAISKFLSNKALTFVAHNSNYDREYLWRNGIRVPFYPNNQDTMLMHHSMEPELKKDLSTLASLHLDEQSWKHIPNAKTNK